MAEKNQPEVVTNDRRRRVNRLKKLIIITALVLIIIPIIMCIILLLKVADLQKTVDELIALKDTGAIVAQQDETGKVHYVYAGSVKDKGDISQEIIESSENEENDLMDQNDNINSEMDSDEEATVPIVDEKEEQIDTGKYVYLTFDDGPSYQTDRIIEILDKYNVKATFFVIGKDDEESRARYKAIVDSGNSIGLHSYTHDYAYIYESIENFESDLHRISNLVYDATGVRSNLYRFPGGSSNSIVDDISIFTKYLTENGYTYYDWNSSSRDAAVVMPSSEDIINTVISEVSGKENVVVLMHDSERKESTVEALPILIEKLMAMGYTLKGIDETSTPVQHR